MLDSELCWNLHLYIWGIEKNWTVSDEVAETLHTCVLKKSYDISRFHRQSLIPVLSLEHLVPLSHAGAPPVNPRRSQLSSLWSSLSGLGGCRHSAGVRIWIGLSPMKQSCVVSSQPSFGYDSNIMSAGRRVGWMTAGALLCDISSSDDFQIQGGELLLSLSEA